MLRRRDFADAVPDHGIGSDAPCPPGLSQGDLESEKAGLRDLHAAVFQGTVRLFSAEHVQQRPIGVLPQQIVALGQLGLEGGKTGCQRAVHAVPLPAVPRADEDHAGRTATRERVPGDLAHAHRRQHLARTKHGQLLRQFFLGAEAERGPVVEVRPPQRGLVTEAGQVVRDFRMAGEMVLQPLGAGGERRRGGR